MSSRLVDFLASLIVPPSCCSCGAEPAGSSDVLCRRCSNLIPVLPAAICDRCAQPLPCGVCPAEVSAWDRAYSACEHRGAAKALVHNLKATASKRTAELMAAEIAGRLEPKQLSGFAILPVPARQQQDSAPACDHAGALAGALSVLTGRPLISGLLSGGSSARQATARRAVRLSHNRFKMVVAGRPPLRCVLVDDVHTTGATFEACASALRSAGAEQIICLSFARAVDRGRMAAAW